MLIGVEEARPYAAHPGNHEFGFTHADLTDAFLYYANDGVCMAFHPMPWPGVWMVHVFAKPEAWGQTKPGVEACLAEFWAAIEPEHLIAWVPPYRRLAKALIRRMGGRLEGTMANGLETYGWRPEWAQ
jgi:hypothetical protein